MMWMTGPTDRPLPDCTNTQREALCEIPNSSGEIERLREALGAPTGLWGWRNSEASELSGSLMKEPGLPFSFTPAGSLTQPLHSYLLANLPRPLLRSTWGGAGPQERQLRVHLLIVLRRSNDL